MSKKKENKKLGMVLNGFLNSKIAEGMKEEEFEKLLKVEEEGKFTRWYTGEPNWTVDE